MNRTYALDLESKSDIENVLDDLLKITKNAATLKKLLDNDTYIYEGGVNTNLLQLLIRLGADVNQKDSRDETPLEVAIRCNDANAIETLADAGGRVIIRNFNNTANDDIE